ncbi:MAG: porin family protein [Bdellovibrionales bacterium]|nr:porin family protein [Bdellovibrionales bacterium]
MRYVLIIASVSFLLSGNTYAQNGDIIIESDLQQEISRESGVGAQEIIEVPAQQQPTQRKVFILNRSTQVQQQPITNVEATPLTDSRAAQLRRARQDAEISTEQKIVEKLEQSRLQDEKDRAQRLFGNKLENQEPQQEVVAPMAQTVQVVPQQQEEKGPSLDEVKEEIIASMREELTPVEEETKAQTYISGTIGLAEYQNAINVESNEAMGISIGTRLDEKFIVEGTFLYSNHYVDQVNNSYSTYFVYDDLDQYNFIAAAKYAPQFGRFSPFIGGLVSYTHRKYTEVNYDNYYSRTSSQISEESETDSFDWGLTLGVDVHLGDNFIIGAEYRYITNLTTKSDSRFLNDYYNYYNVGTPLEEFDYSTFGIVGKVLF